MTFEKCTKCDNVFVGETSRSVYTIGKKHTKSLNRKEERSAFWKHGKDKHNNEIQKFQMNVTGFYFNDAVLRTKPEGVKINGLAEGSLLNSKNEWNEVWSRVAAHSHRNRMPRDDLHEDEEHVCYFNYIYMNKIDILNMAD